MALTKRMREDDHGGDAIEREAMDNCLMLLRRLQQRQQQNLSASTSRPNRLFTCKTCNRKFTSFQALGGHRTSHKKVKLSSADVGDGDSPPPTKAKTHDCSICGQEFPIGQALGGHMRRHRIAAAAAAVSKSRSPTPHLGDDGTALTLSTMRMLPQAAASSKIGLCLDLNLPPWEESEFLKLQLGTAV